MKFLCIACDQAMRLSGTGGPDAGSLTVTFACPACGHRVAMLTNPWETQMVRTLGVKVGGAPAEAPAPFAAVRAESRASAGRGTRRRGAGTRERGRGHRGSGRPGDGRARLPVRGDDRRDRGKRRCRRRLDR